jgi:hypothetical protein
MSAKMRISEPTDPNDFNRRAGRVCALSDMKNCRAVVRRIVVVHPLKENVK